MEIVEKRGTSCRRLTQTYFRLVNWQTYASQNEDFGRRNRSSRGLVQSCATPPHLLDNLHFDHFDKYFNLHVWFSLLWKWSKWRLSNKWGGVAHVWMRCVLCVPTKPRYRTSTGEHCGEQKKSSTFAHRTKCVWKNVDEDAVNTTIGLICCVDACAFFANVL